MLDQKSFFWMAEWERIREIPVEIVQHTNKIDLYFFNAFES